MLRPLFSPSPRGASSRGAALDPADVVAHERCARYWEAADPTDVLPPTRTISGDTVLVVGGVEIRALDMGDSHSDTLYAFHFPSERLVFTAELGLVRAVPPVGVPDRYGPGYRATRTIPVDVTSESLR